MRIHVGVIDPKLLASIPGMEEVSWFLGDPADPRKFQGYTANLDPVGRPVRLVVQVIVDEEFAVERTPCNGAAVLVR
jgi:hypothetical protein